jgi:adenylyl-sulfate kinase
MRSIDKNKGLVIWMTGLPCSGKSAISSQIEQHFRQRGQRIQLLDGDILRKTVSRDLGFSKEDRDKNIERITYIAKLLSDNGVHVIVSFVSPYRKMRDFARTICHNFIEVFVKCDVEECKRRDVKGMYKLAMEGKIDNFTGVQDPYEEPLVPELVLETEDKELEESVKEMIEYLESLKSA